MNTTKKRGIFRRILPFAITAVVALGLGAAIGGAGSSAERAAAPAPTVTVAAPAAEVEDHSEQLATCQAVAEELHAITSELLTGVISPYHEASVMLLDQLAAVYERGPGAASVAELDRGTTLISGSADVMSDLTDRTVAATEPYQACQG